MPFILNMPKLSPTMEVGTIVKWHKQEGDQVAEGDLLFEVATDKATVEYEALDEGFLRVILIKEGGNASVNQPVAVFADSSDENIDDYIANTLNASKKDVDSDNQDQEGTDVESPSSGDSSKSRTVNPGFSQPLFPIEEPVEDYQFAFNVEMDSRLKASPLAKKLAKQKGVSLQQVAGTGPGGRVTSRDVDLAPRDTVAQFGGKGVPDKAPGSYTQKPMTPMRKAIGDKLQGSKTFIPHFYIQQDIDVEPMIDLRAQLKECGVHITYNDCVMRAAALSLKENPVVNSGFNAKDNAIVQFETVDIAVAVSIPEGLITPIIRHVDYKNLGQISSEIKHLASLARDGNLESTQYKGGSFTVSNLGMYGVHDFQAIINPPQVSILAVGGIRDCPVVKNGEVVPGKRMMVSLSSDHRVVDGADGALFLQSLKKYLENPTSLVI